MVIKKTFLIFISILLYAIYLNANESEVINFYDKIKNYDIGHIWTSDKIIVGDGSTPTQRREPLGYFGDNYQRFFIHFNSAVKEKSNPYVYLVNGKTKLKNNICNFQGKITILEAKIYKSWVLSFKQGWVKGKYEFYEDVNQKGSGVFNGNFKTDFLIDKKGNLRYDALFIDADGFENNQFEGTWKKYNSKVLKKCNWGDYRIPDSDELDIGAGHFSPNPEFSKFGWEGYIKTPIDRKTGWKQIEKPWW